MRTRRKAMPKDLDVVFIESAAASWYVTRFSFFDFRFSSFYFVPYPGPSTPRPSVARIVVQKLEKGK